MEHIDLAPIARAALTAAMTSLLGAEMIVVLAVRKTQQQSGELELCDLVCNNYFRLEAGGWLQGSMVNAVANFRWEGCRLQYPDGVLSSKLQARHMHNRANGIAVLTFVILKNGSRASRLLELSM